MTSRRSLILATALAGILPLSAALARPPEGRGGPDHGGGHGGARGHGGGHGGERGHGRGQGHGRGGPERGHGRPGHHPSLGARERDVMHVWAREHPGYFGGPLPPGMRNRLAQGKPLPPGIARRALPPDLLGRLPAYPGHVYWAVGPTVALVETATGLVRAMLYDALLPH